MSSSNLKGGFATVLALIIILLVAGGGFYIYSTREVKSEKSLETEGSTGKGNIVEQPQVVATVKATGSIPGFQVYTDAKNNFSLQYPSTWKISSGDGRVKLESIVTKEKSEGTVTMFSFWTLSLDAYNLPQSSLDKVKADIESKSNASISGVKAQHKVTRDTNRAFDANIDFVSNGKMGNITEKWYVGGASDSLGQDSNKAEILKQFEQIRSSVRLTSK